VFGAKYDGVFVPALTKSQGYFEHLHERGKQDAENDQDAQQGDADTTQATGTTQTQTGA
jgi:hypothetical protein